MLATWTRPDGRVQCLLYQPQRLLFRPRVSVVMPVYNGAAHVAEAVRSVLGQELRQLELIVVDDGSTDETPRILARFARCDGRVRVLRQPHLGLIEALNTGWAAATAPLVARMDADDWSDPTRLRRQVEVAEKHPEVAVVSCGAWVVDEAGNRIERFPDWDAANPLAELLVRNPIVHGTVLIRRSAVAERRPYTEPPEDYWLWVRLAERGHRFYHIAEPLYHFRSHGARYSLARARSQAAGIAAVQRYLIARASAWKLPPETLRARLALATAELAAWAWLAGDVQTARRAQRISERKLAAGLSLSTPELKSLVLRYGWARVPCRWYHQRARQFLAATRWQLDSIRTVVANHPWVEQLRQTAARRPGRARREAIRCQTPAKDLVPQAIHGKVVLWQGPLSWRQACAVLNGGPSAFFWVPPRGEPTPAWLARLRPGAIRLVPSADLLPVSPDLLLPSAPVSVRTCCGGAAGDVATGPAPAAATSGPERTSARTR